MEQTNTANAEEEDIRANLELYLGMSDASQLIEIIDEKPKAFDMLIALITDQLTSNQHDESFDGRFLLNLLESLVQYYQVPAVMAIESPDFMKVLNLCVQNGLSEEVKNLLQECLQAFSFDQKRQTIPLISNFYLETFGSQTFPNLRTPEHSDFIELFCNIQNILLFHHESDKSDDADNILSIMIETLFEHGKFKSITYTPLEQRLINKYKQHLEEIRDSILSKKEEEKKQKIMKQQKKEALKRLPAEQQLKNRKYFVRGEELPFDESIEYEYKDYTFPFSSPLIKTLSKTICSMMNVKGGRIFIGVMDNKIVKGIQLTNVERAELCSTIDHIITSFEPDVVGKDLIKVVFLPVYPSESDKTPIPGLFVVKIIIKQADPAILYSNSKEAMECYIRYEGQSKFLNAKETRDFLIEKFINPPNKISDFEYNDPEPDHIIDYEYAKTQYGGHTSNSHTNHSVSSNASTAWEDNQQQQSNFSEQGEEKKTPHEKKTNRINIRYEYTTDENGNIEHEKYRETRKEKSKNSKGSKGSKKDQKGKNRRDNSHENGSKQQQQHFSNMASNIAKLSVGGQQVMAIEEIFVEGLPAWTQDEFDEFLEGLGFKNIFSYRMFKTDSGKCNGKAFINFKDRDEADTFIQTFNNSSFFGNVLIVKKKNAPQQK